MNIKALGIIMTCGEFTHFEIVLCSFKVTTFHI